MPEPDRPENAKILARLGQIERRLERLEAAARIEPAAPPVRRLLAELKPSVADVEEELPEARPDVDPYDEPIVVDQTEPAEQEDLRSDTEGAAEGDLEHTIGLKWAGWVGAIVLVIGVGLGIKFAYDQGWLAHLPVAVRLGLMSLCGFALLAAGEFVYRRVNIVSAAGLFGAGVAVLFLVSYAGNVYFAAYSYRTAFVFALMTTLIGSAVAVRGRLVSVAMLAQIGGLLGPVILSSDQRPGLALLAYVLMLEIVALIVAQWGRNPKWWLLRGVSLVGTVYWMGLALAMGVWRPGLANEVLWFAAVAAFLYQAELLAGAARGGEAGAAPSALRGWGTAYSLAVTAAFTAAYLKVFYDYDSPTLRGIFTLALAAICVLLAGALRQRREMLLRSLADGFSIQGIALVVLWVPVTLTGSWICLAWGILSLAFAFLHARFRRAATRGAALATWLLALLRLIYETVNATGGVGAGRTWFHLLGEPIRGYTMLGWLVAAMAEVVAMLVRPSDYDHDQKSVSWRQAAVLLALAGSVVWLTVSLRDLPPLGATVALMVWAWLLAGLDSLRGRQELALQALGVLIFASMKWFLYDTLLPRLLPGWDPLRYYPVFNVSMGVAVLLALSLGGVVWLRRRSLEEGAAYLQTNAAVFKVLGFAAAMVLDLYVVTNLGVPEASIVGLVLIGAVCAAFAVAGRVKLRNQATQDWSQPQTWAFLAALAMVGMLTVAFGFEVDRNVARSLALHRPLYWSPGQLRLLELTMVLLVGLGVAALIARRLHVWAPWLVTLLFLLAAKLVLGDMLTEPLYNRVAANVWVVFNFEMFTAVAVLGALLVLPRLLLADGASEAGAQQLIAVAGFLALFVFLVAATLEIDRAFARVLVAHFRDPHVAEQVAISIFWGLFAIATVCAGFRWPMPMLRYFGLGLFGVTLLKVVAVDMSQVEFGYRILSFMGLGLLLLATSVLYGRVGSRLLREARQARGAPAGPMP